MSKQENIDKIQDVINDVKFAMMSTVNEKGDLHAWPMTTNETSLNAKEIWFIGGKTSDVVKDIEKNSSIGLTYASNNGKDYVSITGKAELSDDKNKIEELWSPVYNAFFPNGKEDEDIQLIKVVPHGAECWLSGSSVVNMFKMASAAMQDGETVDELGEVFSVTF